MKKEEIGALYIHLPFCASICPFCDFPKAKYVASFIKPYISSLLKELESKNIKHKLNTIYIGGGTPTLLDKKDLETVLKKVSPLIKENGEFTIETNIENIDEELLLLLKKYRVNRLSIGVQTFNKEILKEIGREKTSYEALSSKLELARSLGFNNINLDFIYGFEGQDKEIIKEDLRLAISLAPEHLSFYSLIIDQGSVYFSQRKKELDQDIMREYYDLINKTLNENGYHRYEISNFAKEVKYQSRHNLTYWKNEEYYAIGMGASGYEKPYRYKNTLSLKKYIDGDYILEKEYVTKEDDYKYFLLTNFRLVEGFSLSSFKERFGFDFEAKYQDEINRLKKEGLIDIKDDKIFLLEEGLAKMDTILLSFID